MNIPIAILLALAANGQAKPHELASSTWDTVYEARTGTRVRATVKIEGKTGTYVSCLNPPIQGQLDHIRHVSRLAHPVDSATPALVGRWRLGGQSGYFVFRHPDNTGRMDGYWGYFSNEGRFGPIVGSWDGRLVAVSDGQLSRAPDDPGPVAPD